MASNVQEKRIAFARQAASDWEVYQILGRMPDLAECHKLHYLQMFLEKLSKAYLWGKGMEVRRPSQMERSHAFVRKVMPIAYSDYCEGLAKPFRPDRAALSKIRELCIEIDRLAPAVDPADRPDNCEYPWEALQPGGLGPVIVAPVDHHFPLSDRLQTPAAVRLLRCASKLLQEILATQKN